MDTQKYRAFVRAVELGSFSAAAEEMRFTPSGISHMAAAVEDEVGLTLLKRGRNGITLTSNGEEMMPVLRNLVHAEASVMQQASSIIGLARGHVTIGAYSSIASQWLPSIIKGFRDEYPGISIQLLEGVHEEIDEWMAEDQLDFCRCSYRRGTELEWIPLKNDPMFAAVSKKHPFAKRKKVKPKECEGQPFIMPGRSNDLDVVDLLRKFSVGVDIEYTTIENYSAISMVECGLGISIMNELITKGRTADIVLVPFDPPQHINLGIGVKAMKTASPAAKKLIEYIRDRFDSGTSSRIF